MTARDQNDSCLDFTSLNDTVSTTIILIHGASSSGADWDLVQPYLNSYHLLMPSLFTLHSLALARVTRPQELGAGGRKGSPQWQARYVHLLANLIRQYAKGGRAHIVGLSLGGSFALALVATHPELSLSLCISGLPKPIPPPSAFVVAVASAGLWALQRLIEALGPNTVRLLFNNEVDPHPGLNDGQGSKTTHEQVRILVDTVASGHTTKQSGLHASLDSASGQGPFRARIVAATGRKWWTPIGDDTKWAIEAGKQFAGCGKIGAATTYSKQESTQMVDMKVYEAHTMYHPWNRQDPELFASCILATIEDLGFPASALRELWRFP